MGAVPRETSCDIVFFSQTDETENFFSRFEDFLAVMQRESPTPLVFIHPLTGAYDALPQGVRFQASAEDRDFIRVSVTFVEAGLDPAAFEAAEDLTGGAEVAQVGVVAGDLTLSAAADPDLPTIDDSPEDIAADSVTTSENWRDDTSISRRQINLELNALSTRIDDAVTELELAQRLDSYPTLRAFQRLHGSLRRAAEATIRTAPKLTELAVNVDQPLLVLLQDFYGGREAIDRFARTLELNDIADPSRLRAGTSVLVELR